MKEIAPPLIIGLMAGLALGFVRALLLPGRRKPATAARMRPIEVPVRRVA